MDFEVNSKDERFAEIEVSSDERHVMSIAAHDLLAKAAIAGNEQFDSKNTLLLLCRAMSNPRFRAITKFAMGSAELRSLSGIIADIDEPLHNHLPEVAASLRRECEELAILLDTRVEFSEMVTHSQLTDLDTLND